MLENELTNMAKNSTLVDVKKVIFRKTCGLIQGDGAKSSCKNDNAVTIPPPTRKTIIFVNWFSPGNVIQPLLNIKTTPTEKINCPNQLTRRACSRISAQVSRGRGKAPFAQNIIAMATGTFSKKIHRHDKIDVIKPPTAGHEIDPTEINMEL